MNDILLIIISFGVIAAIWWVLFGEKMTRKLKEK